MAPTGNRQKLAKLAEQAVIIWTNISHSCQHFVLKIETSPVIEIKWKFMFLKNRYTPHSVVVEKYQVIDYTNLALSASNKY